MWKRRKPYEILKSWEKTLDETQEDKLNHFEGWGLRRGDLKIQTEIWDE